jgi:hypothetical protein
MVTKVMTPSEMRQELMLRLNDVANEWGAKPDLTSTERCHGTVFGVLSVIDGVNGNGPDGEGLPMFQILASPHPDYSDAREGRGLPIFDNGTPLDNNGEYHGDYAPAQLRFAYAHVYDTMKDELAKSAASLFS